MNRIPFTLRRRFRRGFTPTPICIVAEQAKAEDKQNCRQTLNSLTIRKLVRGFTIFELQVVSILMIIVTLITSQFWIWFSPCVAEVTAREHILREARIAMQNLACDFGSASGISVSGNVLGIDKDRDGDSDVYYFHGDENDPNTLQRRVGLTGPELTVADCVSNFIVDEGPPLRITLEFGYHSAVRKLIFRWSEPAP
jgi:hypothetical protein